MTMLKPIFEFDSYRAYITDRLKDKRGERVRLANHLGCQPAFITQVLTGIAHLSQEHGILINEFLQHNAFESDFFILLILYERAGNKKLQDYYQGKIDKLKKERFNFGKQIDTNTELSESDKVNFYSNWYYSAIHVLTSIPDFNRAEGIAKYLNLDLKTTLQALEFLCKVGIVKLENGNYQVGSTRIHLDKASPLINRHHTNWRMRAINALDQTNQENFHYSMVTAIAKKDFTRIKDHIHTLLSQCEKIIKDSPEQEAYALNIDWFEL